MPTYLEKIEAAQKGIDDFYRLLNLYNQSRLNSGWVGTEKIFSNTDISEFETYLTNGNLKNKNESVNATLFDIPMNSRGLDKYGRYGAGIPSDIGFCRNIKAVKELDFEENLINNSEKLCECICYGNDKYIIIFDQSSYAAYSYDGIEWIEVPISTTDKSWYSVCYGNGKFVAIASNGSNAFAYSTDGINWIESTISSTNRYWYSVCYGNGKFVAVSSNSSIFAYSTDGINWIESTISSTKRNWRGLCYASNMFIALVSNSDLFAYSYDGINWIEGTISSTARKWKSVCYGNGKFVAVASNSNMFAYSISFAYVNCSSSLLIICALIAFTISGFSILFKQRKSWRFYRCTLKFSVIFIKFF